MDSALKQRLLGAAVLIALAIIFVPMFLSNTPQQSENTTLNLDIPKAPERKFETRTLPVVDTATAPAPSPAPATDDTNKVTTVDTKAPPKVDVQPEPATPLSTPAPKPPVAEAKAPSTAPSAPAPAIADGRFAVNLGVYADQGHADA